MKDGVSLRSASHPLAPWWQRLFMRPRLRSSSIVTIDLEGTRPAPGGLRLRNNKAPFTLVEKLRYVGSMQVGDNWPDWLGGINGWGPPLSKLANEAADEIERLRAIILESYDAS